MPSDSDYAIISNIDEDLLEVNYQTIENDINNDTYANSNREILDNDNIIVYNIDDGTIGANCEISNDDENWDDIIDTEVSDDQYDDEYEVWIEDDIDDSDDSVNEGNENDTDDFEVIDQYGGGQDLVDIISRNKRVYKTLNAAGLRLEVKFRPPRMGDITQWIKLCINELLQIIEESLQIQPQDRVGIVFTNTNNARVDFSLSFRPFCQYSTDSILFEIENVIQSNSLFFTDDNLIINIDHVRVPVGYGRNNHIGKSTERYFKLHERSIFSSDLQPKDYGLCLAVSIVVGIAHTADDINRYNFLTYKGNYDDLIQEARALCFNTNVDLSQGGGIDEIIAFQQYLGPDYRITIYASRDGKNIYFKACHDYYKYALNILLDENHYSLILSPTAVFAIAYFCGS